MVLPSLINLLAPVDLTIHGTIKNSIFALVWSSSHDELEQMSVQEGSLRVSKGETPQSLISALIFDFRKSYLYFSLI